MCAVLKGVGPPLEPAARLRRSDEGRILVLVGTLSRFRGKEDYID